MSACHTFYVSDLIRYDDGSESTGSGANSAPKNAPANSPIVIGGTTIITSVTSIPSGATTLPASQMTVVTSANKVMTIPVSRQSGNGTSAGLQTNTASPSPSSSAGPATLHRSSHLGLLIGIIAVVICGGVILFVLLIIWAIRRFRRKLAEPSDDERAFVTPSHLPLEESYVPMHEKGSYPKPWMSTGRGGTETMGSDVAESGNSTEELYIPPSPSETTIPSNSPGGALSEAQISVLQSIPQPTLLRLVRNMFGIGRDEEHDFQVPPPTYRP